MPSRSRAALIATLLLSLLPARAERVTAKDIHAERELLITAPVVLDSEVAKYPGSWSFGALVEELVGTDRAPSCVRNWLESWAGEQTVGNQKVAARDDIVQKVIVPWQRRDGYDAATAAKPWEPQMAHAPFRLLAIVNRMDLCAPEVAEAAKFVEDAWRINGQEKKFQQLLAQATGENRLGAPGAGGGYGAAGLRALTERQKKQEKLDRGSMAGEGRLAFGAIDSEGAPLDGGWTVIFEYNLKVTKERSLRQWAEAWHSLGSRQLVDHEFPAELEQVTRAFTHGKPALAQLRTSEAAFGEGREFRQFALAGFELAPAELAQTPAPAFAVKGSAEQRLLSQFLHEQEPLIRSGIHMFPRSLPMRSSEVELLGGNAIIPAGKPDFFWDTTAIVAREARRTFSLNTCTGCHAGETACTTGLHIAPRGEGQEASLSTFLRRDGKSMHVNDPDVKGRKIEYAEMNDRAAILAALLEPRDRATIEALRPVLRARLSRTH